MPGEQALLRRLFLFFFPFYGLVCPKFSRFLKDSQGPLTSLIDEIPLFIFPKSTSRYKNTMNECNKCSCFYICLSLFFSSPNFKLKSRSQWLGKFFSIVLFLDIMLHPCPNGVLSIAFISFELTKY